jgi:hypothetical protein
MVARDRRRDDAETTERGIRSCPVNHVDLVEDVVLGLVVAWTTVAALYVGWRTGRVMRRRTPGWDPGGAIEASDAGSPDAGAVSVGEWNRRLAAEQARSVRHGTPATIVAIRADSTTGPRAAPESATKEARRRPAEMVGRWLRTSDAVYVTGDGTVRILLVEATEVDARRFVARISSELGAADAGTPGMVAAWAAIAPGRDLRAAERLAVARLRGATSGWLRSLAVHRTTGGPVEPVDLDADASETGPSAG